MEFENLQIEIPTEDERSPLFGIKVYEKKYHNDANQFVIGFNPKSKEFIERKARRARRFGIQNENSECESLVEETVEVDTSIPSDGEFMKIDLHNLKWPPVPHEASEEIRFDAILVYGVQDMSTKDVFRYFKLYGPDTLEWIDDFSCNVVWDSNKAVIDAMDNMSKSYTMLSKLQKSSSGGDDEPIENISIKEEEDEDVQVETNTSHIEIEDDLSPKEIWRIALPFKEQQLFFRHATIKDKKLPGAASRSEYYLKYGKTPTPSAKDKSGLISKSRKRKLERMRKVAEDRFKSNEPDVKFVDIPIKKEENNMEVEENEPSVKRINMDDNRANQMTMVADREEALRKLGPKFLDDDVRNRLGVRGEDTNDEEEESDVSSDTEYNKHSGIHDRLGIPNFKTRSGPDVRREIESSKYRTNLSKNMRSHGYEDEHGVYHDIYQAEDLNTNQQERCNKQNKTLHKKRDNYERREDTDRETPVRDLRDKLKNRTNSKKNTKHNSKKSNVKDEPEEKVNLCIEIKQEVPDDINMDVDDEPFEF